MSKVLLLKGLPASGKSTWSREYVEKNLDWVRVNRDDLRRMRGKYWLPKQEDMITKWEVACIKMALLSGKNVIVDATNFNTKNVNKHKLEVMEFCEENKIKVEFITKVFDVPVEECIKRDMKRAYSVGEKVIRDMYEKFVQPNEVQPEPLIQDTSLPKAIICDLDGTLCIHQNRSPYEYLKCGTDKINEKVRDIILNFRDTHKIIFLSGREFYCMNETLKWFNNNFAELKEFSVFMRQTGDFRKDSVIKREIFEQKIMPKYYVDFLLDDRDQVVKMWRELGLTCLQVAEGNF